MLSQLFDKIQELSFSKHSIILDSITQKYRDIKEKRMRVFCIVIITYLVLLQLFDHEFLQDDFPEYER